METRTKILYLIKKNLEEFSSSIINSNYKYQIEYILKQFIGDNSYNYYNKTSKSIMKNNQSHNNSQRRDISSPSSPSSKISYKSFNIDSDFDFDDDDEEVFNEDELEYKILNKSKFVLHTNKKEEKPFIIYDEITLFKKKS